MCLADLDVVVLAGGLGTRLRPVLPGKPKILAPIAGRAFLDILIDRLVHFGAQHVILSLGHLADEVQAHIRAHPRPEVQIDTVVETEPLGTAGALRFVRGALSRSTTLVLNGDSLIDADLCAFVAAHRAGGVAGSILCTRVTDAARFGTIETDGKGRIAVFREKTGDAVPGVINAGIYLLERKLREDIDSMPGPSLERDIFQKLAPGALGAHVGDFAFIDIGTPEDFARAAAFVAQL